MAGWSWQPYFENLIKLDCKWVHSSMWLFLWIHVFDSCFLYICFYWELLVFVRATPWEMETLNPSHTRGGMSQNAVGMKILWYIPGYSKCILKNLSAFQIFGPILVAGPNVLLMLETFEVQSKWIYKNARFGSIFIPYQGTLRWHSWYTRDILSIWAAFCLNSWTFEPYSAAIPGTFLLHSRWIRTAFRGTFQPDFGAVFGQQSNRTCSAFEVHSKYSDCILNIPTVFQLRPSRIRELIRPECARIIWGGFKAHS